jgi:uncharacterized membrane protein (UPF0127 family)
MQERSYQLREVPSGRVIVERLEVARSIWRQAVGLIGRRELNADEGLWLEPCDSIHTFGMRFAIDVLFLDRSGALLRAVSDLRPWRVCWPVRHARTVVEIPAGVVASRNIRPGFRYQIVCK